MTFKDKLNKISSKFSEKNISPDDVNDTTKKNEKTTPPANNKNLKDTGTEKDEKSINFKVLKNLLNTVIEPQERSVRNYVNPSFWIDKYDEISKIRKKKVDDLKTFDQLSEGARPSHEYYILTVLSCIIATFGLIQGSTATIIGAMIVAPLMTPILAFSLGVIWGDIELLKTSLLSIMKGIFWAILISSAISFIIPLSKFSPEIISRTNPTIFDIMVALGSGFVGAYGHANRKISDTLVGIAIAVALMPPLCTVGIGIGKLNMHVATGAAILFLINLVSISLAGALVFWLMRIHPIRADRGEIKKRALSQIFILLIVLSLLSIPVIFFMFEGYASEKAEKHMRNAITAQLPDISVFKLDIVKHEKKIFFSITLTGEKLPDKNQLQQIKEDLIRENPNVEEVQFQFMQSIPIKP